MDAAELRAMQAPIKERYKSDPSAAVITLKAKGSIDNEGIACKVETGRALAVAGLHPATGGSGLELCSGDMPRKSRSPSAMTVPLLSGTSTAVATDFNVTPAQATRASSSMSPEQSSRPEPSPQSGLTCWKTSMVVPPSAKPGRTARRDYRAFARESLKTG
jgi:hypothetical protein